MRLMIGEVTADVGMIGRVTADVAWITDSDCYREVGNLESWTLHGSLIPLWNFCFFVPMVTPTFPSSHMTVLLCVLVHLSIR